MLQCFDKISPLLESLRCALQDDLQLTPDNTNPRSAILDVNNFLNIRANATKLGELFLRLSGNNIDMTCL